MRIGDLAGRTGTSTKTIRYYESIGLLDPPPRAANGYRDYDERAIQRLQFIRDAQATGLKLDEISHITELRDQGHATCDHVVRLLEDHLDDLDGRIETLRRTRDELVKMTARARSLDPADCTNPDRCQTISVGASKTARRRDWRHV